MVQAHAERQETCKIPHRGRTTACKDGFTLVELLVVMSIVVLLIGLLLPALSRARIVTQRIVCASHLHVLGQALTEYATVYTGQYPTSAPGVYSEPFGWFGVTPSAITAYPTWGPALLYYSGWGSDPGTGFMGNIQPGTLNPTVEQISLLYCPQGGLFQEQEFASPQRFNAQGQFVNWGRSPTTPSDPTNPTYIGYCYWVGRGLVANIQTGQYSLYNNNPNAYANRPISPPGSLVMTDDIILTSSGSQDLGLASGGAAWSNHLTIGPLPDGGNELYNDGSVTWVPFSKMKPRYSASFVQLIEW